jgi:hypothetical protein
MKNWKAVVGAILVFVLGGFAGSLTTIAIVRHRLVHGHRSQMMANLIVRRLSWVLRLDTAQRAQLRVIISDGQKEIRMARRQIQPQIEDIVNRSEARVREILQPGQQEKFDKLVAESKAQWAKSKDD